MNINKDTKLIEILKEYPWFKDLAKQIDERFAIIDTPIGKMLAKKYSVNDVAKMANIDVEKVLEEIHSYIEQYNNKEESSDK